MQKALLELSALFLFYIKQPPVLKTIPASFLTDQSRQVWLFNLLFLENRNLLHKNVCMLLDYKSYIILYIN